LILSALEIDPIIETLHSGAKDLVSRFSEFHVAVAAGVQLQGDLAIE
jgi:hypothetical protein